SLRTGQRLDAGDVVDVQVEDVIDRGDRLLVEIHTDARHRAGVNAVSAARDAAHVDLGHAGPLRLERDGRQELDVIGEAAYVEVVELVGPQHLDREGDVLQALGPFLRRYDDLFEA